MDTKLSPTDYAATLQGISDEAARHRAGAVELHSGACGSTSSAGAPFYAEALDPKRARPDEPVADRRGFNATRVLQLVIANGSSNVAKPLPAYVENELRAFG